MTASPRVIAFAGPPGCGKTSLIHALMPVFPQCATIAMDDFSGPETLASEQLGAWLDAGGDFSALDISRFCATLANLKTGVSADAPLASIVLAEAPLGRAHAGSAPLLDTLIWIDLPLDIALARNLLALHAMPGGPPEGWVQGYLDAYLHITRRVLEHQDNVIRAGADYVIDGRLPLPDLANAVLKLIVR